MARGNASLHSFNRGLLSKLALARVDLDRTGLSAEVQTNWMPRTLGSAMLRPGKGFKGNTLDNNQAIFIPFIFSIRDIAGIEITDEMMRVWDDGTTLVTRASVSTTIANGSFTTDLTSWTDDDDSGAASAWATGGYMGLTGTGLSAARRYQQLTIGGADQGTVHGLRIVIARGEVYFRAGSTQGDDDLFGETLLREGTHSIAIDTSGSAAYIEFYSYTKYESLVENISIESSGTLELPTPWAEEDLYLIRHDQSADVVFVACEGYQQRRIERRDNNSWSVVKYQPKDGPFELLNSGPIVITPSAINGDITLTASASLFSTSSIGQLYQLQSVGQEVEADITAQDQFTDSIRVVGTGNERIFTITRAGTWNATVTLQRSVGEEGSWVDVGTYTTNGSVNFNDSLSNQIVYYRIGVKTGDFTSGTVELSLDYANGTKTGSALIVGFNSATEVTAIVLVPLGGTEGTVNWRQGSWSPGRGYPSAVALYEGRLWWAGKDRIDGSISDAYDSFDPDYEGDAGPISRTLGFGPVDRINFLIALQRLVAGAEGSELVVRSSSFDEPLTPSNFNIKAPSSQGSSNVAAVKVDTGAFFVQRSGARLFNLLYDGGTFDYDSQDVMLHVPEVGEPSILRLAVQRQPDTRVHCVRSDGKVAVLVFDRAENVLCWILVETVGDIEDVMVLPGTVEDQVYYVVKRTIDGSTVRHYEKWALENECAIYTTTYRGASTTTIPVNYEDGTVVTVRDSEGNKVENLTVADDSITLSSAATYAQITPSIAKLADAFIEYDGSETDTITGLDHLEGETVVAFGDGKSLGSYTVTSGQIMLSEAVEKCIVGLGYTADFKSSKLAYFAQAGSALTQKKRIEEIGLVLANCHAQGIKFGRDFDNLDPLPLTQGYGDLDQNTIHESFDEEPITFPGSWDTDARLCLRAVAPLPCTLLAAILKMNLSEKV